MRPKIVMLTLVVAVGLVALAAVLRGMMGGHARPDTASPVAAEPAVPAPANAQAANPVNPNSTNTEAVLAQLRAAELAKELDQVRELQASGAGNPTTTELLLAKVTHREPEVRKAAVDALVQLNDTNAIPGLEQAAALAENPRDKITLMQAIEYLKLPEDAPPPPATSAGAGDPTPPPSEVAPRTQRDPSTPRPPRERKARNRRTTIPPAAPGAQPVSPAPGAAPPQ